MTSEITNCGNGNVVVHRGSIVVRSGNATATTIVITGNRSVQAAQIDVAGFGPTTPTRFRALPLAPRSSDQPSNAAATGPHLNDCHPRPVNAHVSRQPT
jgi:hypothetical protein